MLKHDRREMIKIVGGGLTGLGMLGRASATLAKETSSVGIKVRVKGSVPLLPNLARVMPETPVLLDALATEFAPLASSLATQKAYWLAINAWITDRLSGPIMEGQGSIEKLGEQAWAVYASSYWGGVELRENWGMPPVMQKLGIKMQPPFTQFQQTIVDNMTKYMAALAGGGDQCLQVLPAIMREGMVHIMAYNAGVVAMMTEDPPVGQRHPPRAPKPSEVRINPRDFMRVDYDFSVPHYLKVWRSNYERAVTANPQAYAKAIVGESGQKDLREIWKQGVAYGNTTWGGGASDKWTDAYFDDSVHWTLVLNMGLEAVCLAAFVAVINQDPEAAKLALMGHALYAGATPGWGIGLLDTTGKLPAVVASAA